MTSSLTEIENRLWDAADELRANSKLKSSEYSVPVLGLIFLRYADHRFTTAEAELAILDLLLKPAVELTKEERESVKEVAHELLETLKREKLILDWRKKQQSRAAVRLAVEEMLDGLPEVFDKRLYDQKCDLVCQHVYESYYGAGDSVYGSAA